MKKLFIAWYDKEAKRWFPIGLLAKRANQYYFCYTKGAKLSKNFTSLGAMTELSTTYYSSELFPVFSNRLLGSNRPEFSEYLEWLGLKSNTYDPLDALALTEGKRETDSIEIFPCPHEDTFGNYTVSFFSHGLRYIGDESLNSISEKKPGDILYLVTDPQNRYDSNAILLRTDDPVVFAGYCPRYLVADFHLLLKANPQLVNVKIKQINNSAPLQFKLMCTLTCPWPKEFIPCSTEEFLPLADDFPTNACEL